MSDESRQRAADIALLALDVDGVLTDGSIVLDDDGREIKRFDARDGLGLTVWQRLGFGVAILTGRVGKAVLHRADELGIRHIIQGAADKSAGLDTLLARAGVSAERVAYIGDDWPDLPVLRRVGYPMAVSNADERLKAIAEYTTVRPGGHGAVREAIEHLLTAKDLLERAAALYDTP